MDNGILYRLPDRCAWCGKEEVVSKRKVKNVVFTRVTDAGTTLTSTIQFDLPICSESMKQLEKAKWQRIAISIGIGIISMVLVSLFTGGFDLFCSGLGGVIAIALGFSITEQIIPQQEVYIPHGNHVEFLNQEFHKDFATLNPSIGVIGLKDEVLLPNLCAWCGSESIGNKVSGKVSKFRFPLPICNNCQKENKHNTNAIGAYLAGRPYFYNFRFFAEFLRLNPSIAYDHEQAILDGVYEWDFETNFGVPPDSMRPAKSFGNKKDQDFYTVVRNAISNDDGTRRYYESWFTACNLDEDLVFKCVNLIYAKEDKQLATVQRWVRLINRIQAMIGPRIFGKDITEDVALLWLGIVATGFKAANQRVFALAKEDINSVAEDSILEMSRELRNLKDQDKVSAEQKNDSRDVWKFFVNKTKDAELRLQDYFMTQWPKLGIEIVKQIIPPILSGDRLLVYQVVSQKFHSNGSNHSNTSNEVIRIFLDLYGLERQIGCLKFLDDKGIDTNSEFLLS